MAVIGSGGHTTEMIEALSALGGAYNPRIYVLAETDRMSEQKVRLNSPYNRLLR